MLQVRDYLGLTPADARTQWRAILERNEVERGGRQDNFTPIETLLCFGFGLVGTRSTRGRINIRESDPVVLALATLFKRPVGSLGLKLENLDGRREHGAKSERDLWIALTSNRFRFQYLNEVIVDAGRVMGIDFDHLPEFLGAEDSMFAMFPEANQVTNESLREEVELESKQLRDNAPLDDSGETEKLFMASACVGQIQLAHAVLDNCGFICVFCGLGFRANRLPSSKMLVASHIKAWRASDNRERLDSLNGLAACPTHDAAFDSFLITVSDDFEIVRGVALVAAISNDPIVSRNLGIEGRLSPA